MSILIKDTTKEQRIQIVRESLEYSDVGCECSGMDYDMYLPYIEGHKEIAQINTEYRYSLIQAHPDLPLKNSSCMDID